MEWERDGDEGLGAAFVVCEMVGTGLWLRHGGWSFGWPMVVPLAWMDGVCTTAIKGIEAFLYRCNNYRWPFGFYTC